MVTLIVGLVLLGFCVEELPALSRQRREKLETQMRTRERDAAKLALAIDTRWPDHGCLRGLTPLERGQAQAQARVYGGAVLLIVDRYDGPPPPPAPMERQD